MVGNEKSDLLESVVDLQDMVLESIALLVGRVGCKLVMPCGVVGPGAVDEMNKLLNPVNVKARHEAKANKDGGHPLVLDFLVFERTTR